MIPFEFNNKNYTECTADVASHDWKEQWRGPWCPVTRYSSKKEERLRCVRKGEMELYPFKGGIGKTKARLNDFQTRLNEF